VHKIDPDRTQKWPRYSDSGRFGVPEHMIGLAELSLRRAWGAAGIGVLLAGFGLGAGLSACDALAATPPWLPGWRS
jgi:hypothetical protein